MSAEDRNGEVSTDEKCTDCTTQERSFDELTRGLASATVSRRGALRLLAGALFGGVLASVPGVGRTAQALEAPGGSTCVNQGNSCAAQHCCEGLSCLEDMTSSADKFCCPDLPLQIVCGKHCCPTGAATCSAGNCVCPPASPDVCPDPDNINFAGKCTDVATDVLNCGKCGIACPEPTGADAPCRVRACVNGVCTTVAKPDTMPPIPCEDGNPCTVGDTCNTGTCQSGEPVRCEQCLFCDPEGTTPTCVPDPGQVGQRCNDNNACTDNDVCTGTEDAPTVPTGICAGTEISCDDNNPCTIDTCNPATGCVNTNEPPNTPCGVNQICCPPASGAAICVSNQTRNNCGTCGNQCASGADCCGGVCTALNTGTNCGACGVVCDASKCETCQADPDSGQLRCASTCAQGQRCDNGTCVNVCSAATCTGCCDATGTCRAGTSNTVCGSNGVTCVNCPSGTSCCSGTCVALNTAANCGSCGTVCSGTTSFCCPAGSRRMGCRRPPGAACSNDNQCCNLCVSSRCT